MPYLRTDRRNKLYYELIGNPDLAKTLVFIHGWAETHNIWREQVDFFKNDYSILTIDLRGFGLSTKPAYGYSLRYQARNIQRLIQTLNINDYWVIGHSLGGMIALQFCEYYAQKMKGAVILGTTSYLPTKLSIWRNLGTFFISKTLRQIWQRTLKSIRIEHQRSLVQDLLHDVDSVPLYVSAAYGISVLNLRLDLEAITCPVLIIVGENDDLTPVILSERMHEKLLNSQLVIIPETGHMTFIENPEEINSRLANFFQQTS